jgi:hypothetical protein
MLKCYAFQFAELQSRLECFVLVIADLAEGWKAKYDVDFEVAKNRPLNQQIEEWLERAEHLCAELNLRSAHEHVARVRTDKPWLGTHFAHALKEVHRRIEDDLKHVSFLLVPLSKIKYYDRPYFGESVESRFLGARDDMREAATCFALGRWTAVVHHCMAIVQWGMIELGKDLNCELDKYLHDWNDMLTNLQQAIETKRATILGGSKAKASPSAKSKWAEREPFYSEVLGDVRDMKNAWRNPGFHFRLPPFDETKARKVLEKVRDFMVNLANSI